MGKKENIKRSKRKNKKERKVMQKKV